MKGVWIVVAVLLAATAARADERKFTYSNEAKTLSEGKLEFEQWATLMTRKEEGIFRKLVLRSELEYGFTDHFTGAAYLNLEVLRIDGVPGLKDESEVEFESISLEAKYGFTDPSVDPVGLLAYAEISIGEDEYELELKAVASKNIGEFTLAYNLVLEIEWEEEDLPGGGTELEHEFLVLNTFGFSYSANESFALGAEAVRRTVYNEDMDKQHDQWFFGPNWHVSLPTWWLTFTALRQVDFSSSHDLDLDEWEKYEFRVIVGTDF